jgi:prolyl-tRNA synthetase
MARLITPLSKDVNEWYNDVVLKAELADYATVRGSMIIRPYGFDIWRRIQEVLGASIRGAGVRDAYFPLFIPESFLKREAKHVEGFAPEVAWVTEAGGKELAERLAVRPTSETIMYDTFSRWIHSHRDLPLKINQWANVVRWELRTKPFLRTTEFLWQEGHTVHASLEEAEAETMRALTMYEQFCREWLAMPVLTGKKTDAEKFAGALYTSSIETLLLDGKALQAGTSHNLGQNFAKVFKIQYADQSGALQYPWQTSWGMSTRIIGGLILTHGDDRGLVLPPKIAPIQVVVVPIYKTDQERTDTLAQGSRVVRELQARGVRVEFDQRQGLSPGYKFTDWEVRGVPLRIEVGPKDVQAGQVVLVPRTAGKKSMVKLSAATESIIKELDTIQVALLDRATEYRESHTSSVESYEDFKETIETKKGFVRAGWCGSAECESQIKQETKATIRVIPFVQSDMPKKCLKCAKTSKSLVIFARAH